MRAALTACLLAACSVHARDEVVRYPLGNGSTFPIARAVTVPAGFELIYHSGVTGLPANTKAPPGSPAYWGDTRTQALSALTRLKESLAALGLTLGDVVKMTVFLVGDPAQEGRMDFEGFMQAYRQFFGTPEQ